MKAFSLLLTTLLFFSCQPDAINEVQFLKHDLNLEINLEKQEVVVQDDGVMRVNEGVNVLYLPPNASVEHFSIDGQSLEYDLYDSTALKARKMELGAELDSLGSPVDGLALFFSAKNPKNVEISLKYTAVFDADVSEVKFSNQNVGREITATIQEKGAYFSPASFYYPQGDDGLMDFRVTTTIPAHWESISDGNKLAHIESGDTKVQVWENPFKSDGLMFMAAPFVVKQAMAGDVEVYCYFFEEDTSLFETYLPATVNYVNMYSEMIGPYPYKRFTVAENFFPTGYGMPAWTLLGQQVIRLPFIVMTSLGHEVLHNWWGNSIYVDYGNGNWCEGLTVYGADYHYKAQRSAASARDYRKDILKQYKSYVNAENEFPVREFKARHNAESRTLGYNKVMMIFHMIQEEIGEDAFFQAWQDVFAGRQGQKVTWEEWLQAYESASGKDLSHIIPQWVDRKGAARFRVKLLDAERNGNRTHVKFQVDQLGDDLYDLSIPVRFLGDSPEEVRIGISASTAQFEYSLDGDFKAFELDPDYDVFRHLYPQEVEPILAAVMGVKDKQFIYYDEQSVDVLKGFGDKLTETETKPVSAKGLVSAGLEGNYALVSLNPPNLPPSLRALVKTTNTSIEIDGKSYPREGHTFVLSADEEEIAAKLLILLSEDEASLPRIGELIPHYGKYSYLVFKGSRNVGKGQWPALESPLRVNL